MVGDSYANGRGVMARTASPYLPQQWNYDGTEPEQAYHNFAVAAGCVDAQGHSYNNQSILDCLTLADTIVLQNASAHVSGGYKYGQWAFVPVTDTKLILERPSVQLNAGNVNGLRMLSSVSLQYHELVSKDSGKPAYNPSRITQMRAKGSHHRTSHRPLTLNNSSLG